MTDQLSKILRRKNGGRKEKGTRRGSGPADLSFPGRKGGFFGEHWLEAQKNTKSKRPGAATQDQSSHWVDHAGGVGLSLDVGRKVLKRHVGFDKNSVGSPGWWGKGGSKNRIVFVRKNWKR